MTWDTETADLMLKNITDFGTAMTITHVSARTYNTTTLKNEKTSTTLSVTGIRGRTYRDQYSPASAEVWKRKYTFSYDPVLGNLLGQSVNIDKEDQIVDGIDTWEVTGREVVGHGHGLEVMTVRVRTSGG